MIIERMAVVNADNEVVNVIVYDTEGSWTPPDGCFIVDAGLLGKVGDTWDGEQFVTPVDPPIKAWWQK